MYFLLGFIVAYILYLLFPKVFDFTREWLIKNIPIYFEKTKTWIENKFKKN